MQDVEMINTKDAPKELSFTSDGLTVTMERQGEHGLVHLSLSGKTKEKLPDSVYTSFATAKQAIEHFFEENKRKKAA